MAQWGEDGPAPIEPVNPIDYLNEIDIFGNYVRDPSDIKYLIYEQGSNSSSPLETLFPNKTSFPTDQAVLVPPIPFRLNNINLSQLFTNDKDFDEGLKERIRNFKEHHDMDEISDLYKASKQAFNKAYSVNGYKKLDKVILKNDNLADIDYTYLFFGVSLNTLSSEGKEYLFHFFKNLHNLTTDSFNSPNGFFVKANKEPLNFSYTISWTGSSFFPNVQAKKEHSFLKKAKFEKNKKYTTLYASKKIVIPIKVTVDNEETYIDQEVTVDQGVYFIKKNKNNTYDYWDGKSEYEESAFIVPIHMGLFKNLSTLAQAELGQSFAYLIFNCYERKRLKWYATKSFSSFFTWLSCVAVFVTWGLGSANTLAAAAENAGTTGIGMTASEAIAQTAIQGISKALAAIVVSRIIIKALTPILGAKYANILGSVAAAMTAAYFNTGSLEGMFDALTKADNLISLGLSTLDGYSKGLEAEVQQIVRVGQQQILEIQNQVKEFNEKYAGIFGETNMWANESFFFRLRTQISPAGYFYFTLPRGAEIAERTLDYTVNYPEYSTRTYLATE